VIIIAIRGYENTGFQTESGMTGEGLDSRLHGNDSGGYIVMKG